jgi:tRNA-(ms[2]io[6]A)-hydroxylase
MLSLQSRSSERWLRQVEENVGEVLIDHAHCERKAAATAMGLLTAYVENEELCVEMTRIVNEELEHFHMVIGQLKQRGIPFRRLKPSPYGRLLHESVRKQEPLRAIDRLLIAGLIEARSCERFGMLRDRLADRELAAFFGGLFESEARHHSTYVRLAQAYGTAADVRYRLQQLAAEEARVIALGSDLPRMHS